MKGKKKEWFKNQGINLLRGLVSYWKLDDVWTNTASPSSSIFLDSSGNGHNGIQTSISAGVWNGRIGTSCFTPTDGDLLDINISGTTDFNFGNDGAFSISCWNWMDSAINTAYGLALICRLGNTTTGSDWRFRRSPTFPHYTQFELFSTSIANKIGRISTVAATSVYTGGSLWIHYGVTYDGSKDSNGIKIYHNGLEVSTNNSNSGVYTGQNNSSNKISIGNIGNEGRTRSRYHDDYKIWNRVLSAEEMLLDFTNGVNGLPLL